MATLFLLLPWLANLLASERGGSQAGTCLTPTQIVQSALEVIDELGVSYDKIDETDPASIRSTADLPCLPLQLSLMS
jgi:hypothetical protein